MNDQLVPQNITLRWDAAWTFHLPRRLCWRRMFTLLRIVCVVRNSLVTLVAGTHKIVTVVFLVNVTRLTLFQNEGRWRMLNTCDEGRIFTTCIGSRIQLIKRIFNGSQIRSWLQMSSSAKEKNGHVLVSVFPVRTFSQLCLLCSFHSVGAFPGCV